ncbi:M14 family metallopeptidase [Hymenobacter cellulosilyticus]|uniref:M14 family metallopeptidase n=1 Tax=Hymenobacter cellulosilyticus TaxID=2932248 RepID=A0A8T9Q2W9_9BACT|nr:M14 family metallopeptidase [Hymenobacter cellulosilyticus]UOQ70208.1 M14 family metallopeptidase [Hymenobacter cellulosilyticus]
MILLNTVCRVIALGMALMGLTCPNLMAQDVLTLPPVLPWSGKSERLIVKPNDPWITPAELANFQTTPRYAEVRSWLERLTAASPLLTLQTFGRTGEGRDLLYVRARKGGAVKPVVLVQAGIHSGEIDGKDAGLMLLRDIALRGKDDLLDHVDLVFVPIYNIDGHEQMSPWNFVHVRGPAEKGRDANARNIDLNRDYGKLDAPESRAMIGLLRQLDPILYVDCHVSEGFDMQYDVTFTYAGWGRYARHRATADWLQGRFGPAVTQALTKAGHIPIMYPSPIDTREPTKGIRYSPEGPRYSTGYGDFIGVPTVLVENHMLKPYRQRVLGTYVLLEAALKIAAKDAKWIVAAKAKDRASRPTELLTRWKPAPQPIGWIEQFKGVAFELYSSPASGRLEQRWLGQPITFRMPIIGQQPTEMVRLPKAWWVPAAQVEVIDRLRLHGIIFETSETARTLRLDQVRLVKPQLLQPNEGRVPMTATFVHALGEQMLPAGSVRVPADQPNGLLAAALLEPESQDSFLAWGFFPELLSPAPNTDAFVLAALGERLLATNPSLKAEFEAKLRADTAFAADPDARLAWLYAHAGPGHSYPLRYPIARELN